MLPAISLVLPFGQALRICFRNTANFQLQRFAFTICITKYISYISPFGCFTKRGRQKIIQVDIKNIIAKKNKSSHKLADRNTQNFNEGKKVPNDKRKQADRWRDTWIITLCLKRLASLNLNSTAKKINKRQTIKKREIARNSWCLGRLDPNLGLSWRRGTFASGHSPTEQDGVWDVLEIRRRKTLSLCVVFGLGNLTMD